MNLGLEGRTALVLGASSGLGLASAESLREEGARVVMFARREDVLRQEADRLEATAVAGDLYRHEDLHRAVDAAVETYGGLDILVVNGGGPPPGTAVEVSEDSIQRAVDLLLRPIVALIPCRPATPAQQRAGTSHLDLFDLGPRADPQPRPLQRHPARCMGLPEDARQRARQRRDHRQLRGARTNRHRADEPAVRGGTAPIGVRRDPGRTPRRAQRAGRHRLLPRL